ncbi:hypothetical protein [Evansella cellulosilytica]|uniref:Uncharacterized protein n=1 Tax=Evansella cellulosilytica (strain ATCC 21833 / DSM 2522 / FERM P-1141 / JCM 9156 / N-4) TaxID=649639 RepID=E6U179_EVAC2|nr:hypothetical protein [Evansella cellulosilytica]ADU31525.1 hypothetical protein Bcell_3283 [Evansella cellulosilytica DSM 2522]
MQQVPLKNLVQTVSPEWLHLLKEEERSQWVVLRDGIQQVNEDDLVEIVEAVILEHQKVNFYQ